ncbi:RebB like protein [Skermanella stibiiresistens SB22]|uniref:RebB like protein n=1 Tax=Skermanella stibiiresistens SB22 TaxID=1385369 RepID=W9GX77_9PROT|nr:RebB family R body protein [Skermanella stibiiresistens]EWY38409.1 RebB like protein [Skermanella stibiiresistens SB22]
MPSAERPTNGMTDAVASTNVQVLGSGPAMAMASQYQTGAQAAGLAALNAVAAQHNQYMQHRVAMVREVTAVLPSRHRSRPRRQPHRRETVDNDVIQQLADVISALRKDDTDTCDC